MWMTMKRLFAAVVVAGLATASAIAGDPAKRASSSEKESVTVNPGDLKWGDVPPDLPKGAQLALLHGDPAKKAPFTLRLKMPPGYKIPPHWHTNDEQLTILSGKLVLHVGDTMNAPAHELGPGAYHFLPGKAHHAAEANAETVVQLDGVGPFDIHYLNPADNPKKSAEK